MGVFKNKYNLMFIGFMIFYMFLLNYNNVHVLEWDDSRHAVQGHLMYDYFRTLASGDYMSYSEFVGYYGEKGISPGSGYNIGWYAWFDPPAYAIGQAIVFWIMGASVFTARFTTHLMILFLSPFLYLLASRILSSKKLGLIATVIFFMSYIGFYFGRLAILAVPIALLMCGWYYLLFYGKSKTYAIKISQSITLRFKWTVFWSAICLTAATLMKYQSLIFAVGFMAVYILYLFISEARKKGIKDVSDIFSVMKSSGGWSLGWNFVFQVMIVFLIGGIWMKAALLDNGMLDRIRYEGTGRQRDWTPTYILSFVIQTFAQTRFSFPYDNTIPGNSLKYIIPSMAWFALIPIIAGLRKGSFLKKNPRLFIYIGIIYLISTFLISNRQLRYMIHAIPFVAMLIALGIGMSADFLKKRFNFKYGLLLIMIPLIGGSLYVDDAIHKMSQRNYGVYSDELVQYMDTLDNPKLLLNIKNKIEAEETGYYYNPDLFIFEAMTVNDKFNARTMDQYVSYVPWVAIESNHKDFFSQVSQFNDQMKTYIVAFKYDAGGENMVAPMREDMKELGFTETELEWYYVYEK